MRSSEPLSVLMPVRNGAQTLNSAVNDVLSGLRREDELLVVNDGSEDASLQVLDSIRDSRLRVISTPGYGLVSALNLGLREATNRWVSRVDADDRYPIGRFEGQRSALGPNVVLVSGDYAFVANGRIVGDMPTALTHPFVLVSLLNPQRVPHPGVTFDREAVMSAGGYRREDFPAEDLALWLRLAREGRFIGVPTATVQWTMGHGSVTHSNQELQRGKTLQLLKESFPLDLLSGIAKSDVDQELAAYRGTRLEAARRTLLVRDLRALAARGGSKDAYREGLRQLARRPMASLQGLAVVSLQKRRRDQVRRSVA